MPNVLEVICLLQRDIEWNEAQYRNLNGMHSYGVATADSVATVKAINQQNE